MRTHSRSCRLNGAALAHAAFPFPFYSVKCWGMLVEGWRLIASLRGTCNAS